MTNYNIPLLIFLIKPDSFFRGIGILHTNSWLFRFCLRNFPKKPIKFSIFFLNTGPYVWYPYLLEGLYQNNGILVWNCVIYVNNFWISNTKLLIGCFTSCIELVLSLSPKLSISLFSTNLKYNPNWDVPYILTSVILSLSSLYFTISFNASE